MLHFLRAIWAYILSIFAASPSTPPAPSPPHARQAMSSPVRQPATLPPIFRPSKSPEEPVSENIARRDEQDGARISKHGADAQPRSPPPQIFVQDWSSVSVNMDQLCLLPQTPESPPPSVSTSTPNNNTTVPAKTSSSITPLSPPLSPSFSNSNLLIADDSLSSDLELGLDPTTAPTNSNLVVKSCAASFILPAIPKVVFPISNCTSSALSALSGVLWDSPSSHATAILPVHSIPLPQFTSTPPRFTKSSSRLPYPDLFDFNMYSYPSNESIQDILDRSDNYRRWSESRRFSSVSVSMRKSVLLARRNQDREHVVIGQMPSVEQDLDLSIDSSLEERLEAACEDVTQFWSAEEFLVLLKEV